MDPTRQAFMNILRCALRGESAEASTDLTQEQWTLLLQLAAEHHLLPVILEAVHGLPALQGTPLLAAARQQVRQQVYVQIRKSCSFLDLYRQFLDAGLRPLVVKGILCRQLYPQPDQRISADEDLLVAQDQVLSCHGILTKAGLTAGEDPANFNQVYEIPYRGQNNPLFIELHSSLFPPDSDAYGDLNRFFAGAENRAVTETIQGVPVATLDHTDHLFYLLCHAFKHFLHSGFGVRQVCDIILFANAYGSRIDWVHILSACRQIRADRFAAALFRIGEKHLVFDPEQACYPAQWREIQVDETALLEDLLAGGVYGGANRSRKHSSNITLNAVAAQKQGKTAGNALLLSLFPPAKNIAGRYPFLKKHPYLLPAAWIHRACCYRKESRTTRDNSAAEALKIGNRRIALLQEYGILE